MISVSVSDSVSVSVSGPADDVGLRSATSPEAPRSLHDAAVTTGGFVASLAGVVAPVGASENGAS